MLHPLSEINLFMDVHIMKLFKFVNNPFLFHSCELVPDILTHTSSLDFYFKRDFFVKQDSRHFSPHYLATSQTD